MLLVSRFNYPDNPRFAVLFGVPPKTHPMQLSLHALQYISFASPYPTPAQPTMARFRRASSVPQTQHQDNSVHTPFSVDDSYLRDNGVSSTGQEGI